MARSVAPLTLPLMLALARALVLVLQVLPGQASVWHPLPSLPTQEYTASCWGAYPSPAGLGPSVAVYAGSSTLCSLSAAGALTCWGEALDSWGVTVPANHDPVVQVSPGRWHICALHTDGTVSCWGSTDPSKDYGQFDVPAGLQEVVKVSTFHAYTCALFQNATVTCWGSPPSFTAANYSGYTNVMDVQTGEWYTCLLLEDGTVPCMGPENRVRRITEEATLSQGDYVQVSVSYRQLCLLLKYGNATCWGMNNFGQSDNPTLSDVVEVKAGWHHACARHDDGALTCWGRSDFGEQDPPACRGTPVSLEVGVYTTCALAPAITCTTTSTSSTTYTNTTTATSSTTTSSTATTMSTTSSTITWTSTTSSTSTGTPTTTTSSTGTGTSSTTSTSTGSSTTSATSTGTSSTSSTSTWTSTATTSSTSTGTSMTTSTSTGSSTTSATRTGTSSTSSTSTWTSTSTVSSTSTGTSTTTSTSTGTSTTTSTSSGTSTTSSTGTGTSSTSSTSTGTSSTSSTDTWTSTTTTSSTGTRTSLTGTSTASSTGTGTSTRPVLSDTQSALEWIAWHQSSLLQELLADPNSSATTASAPFVSLAGFWAGPHGGGATLWLEGTAAAVTVPPGVFMEPHACIMSVFTVSAVEDWGVTNGDLLTSMSLNCFTELGLEVTVRDLESEILLTLPVNHSAGVHLQCSYWNETVKAWMYNGLTDRSTSEQLVCGSSHLTLFGGIARGAVQTVACAHWHLLSSESLSLLVESDWYASPAGLGYWSAVSALLAMFAIACMLDCRKNAWSDENFLVPLHRETSQLRRQNNHVQDAQRAQDAQFCKDVEGENSLVEGESNSLENESVMSGQSSRCRGCPELGWGSAFRDAADDLLSNLFIYFSEVRDFIESVARALGVQGDQGPGSNPRSRVWHLVHGSLTGLLVRSAKQQTCAALFLSAETVDMVVEDENAGDLLMKAASLRWSHSKIEEEHGWVAQAVTWDAVHEKVLRQLELSWHSASSWGHVPGAAARVCVVSHPLVLPFLSCFAWPSSLRVLLFACELAGTILIATFFYEASGESTGSRRARGNCSPSRAPAMMFGRLLVIAATSLLAAGVPVWCMAKLHQRTFKNVPVTGGLEWKRQLRSWRLQDSLLWALGTAYLAFCLLFTAAFVANATAQSLLSWATCLAISFSLDMVIVPLSIGLLLPTWGTAVLHLLSHVDSQDKESVLREKHLKRQGTGNWSRVDMPAFVSI